MGAIQLQVRRGSIATMKTFVGAPGEITVDTTVGRVVLHDGLTLGGFAMEKIRTTTVASSVYTILPTDVIVLLTKASARTVTMPSLQSYPLGQKLSIVDVSASSTINNITLLCASTGERIVGPVGGSGSSSIVINFPNTAGSLAHASFVCSTFAAAGSSPVQTWSQL